MKDKIRFPATGAMVLYCFASPTSCEIRITPACKSPEWASRRNLQQMTRYMRATGSQL